MRTKRKESLSHLPVTRRRVQVTPDELPPGTSREDFYELDARVVSRIVHVREHLEVVEYELQTLRSKTDEEVFVRACAPASVIEGGMWDASVYAHAVVSKCVDSIPLYRQERILGRAGYAVARSVLCGLFHRAAELLAPIYCNEVVAYAFSDTRGSETPKRRLRGKEELSFRSLREHRPEPRHPADPLPHLRPAPRQSLRIPAGCPRPGERTSCLEDR